MSKSSKPGKPYPEFPLFAHASGRWAKKINGQLHYFGQWGERANGKYHAVPGDGWKAALELYQKQIDDLRAGRVPRDDNGDGTTMRDLCNAFLESKQDKLESGESLGRPQPAYVRSGPRAVRGRAMIPPADVNCRRKCRICGPPTETVVTRNHGCRNRTPPVADISLLRGSTKTDLAAF